MDIFRFHNPTEITKMEQGEIINGIDSKMWIERYRQAGEFTFRAKTSSGLKDKLPRGSFVSHVDTKEIMIVENHEIIDSNKADSEIVITGSGFETFLQNRVVGNFDYPTDTTPYVGAIPDYVVPADYTWYQAVILVKYHIDYPYVVDHNNDLPWVQTSASVSSSGPTVPRTLRRGTVYSRLIELLEIDDVGIKIVRPGPWSGASPGTAMIMHKGLDRTNEVILSNDTGEIETADYLWSIKRRKTAAVVTSRWMRVFVPGSGVGYERRVMELDASDIDNYLPEPPSGSDLTDLYNALYQRGLDAIASQNDVALTKAEISRTNVQYRFRIDYDVGDLVSVIGDYNESSIMRVSEYVEIEDATGQSGYPTLAVV